MAKRRKQQVQLPSTVQARSRCSWALGVGVLALGAVILVGQHPLALSFTHPLSQLSTESLPTGADPSSDGPGENLEFDSSPAAVMASLIAPLAAGDGLAAQQVASYLSRLGSRGFSPSQQGVWFQTQDQYLFDHQGSEPLPAASLVKVAVTLAALDRFGAEHRFETQFVPTGPIEAGTLRGDLVVIGGEDPFFVWEAAVSVGQRLQETGIQRIEGDLVIQGRFYMNFLTDPARSGDLLRQGLNAAIWPAEAEAQFQTLPAGTPRPQIEILGAVRVADASGEARETAPVRHYSLPLAELLKLMNRYSNNLMADMVANAVGGHQQVAARSAELIGIPQSEIQLINGSGLGMENRMSPRAVVGLFLQIQKLAGSTGLTVGDLFEVVGLDEGVLEQRLLPAPLVAKSGTLNQISSLAGVIPTRDRGLIWFAIMNQSPELVYAREQQGRLLSDLQQGWGRESILPATLQPQPSRRGLTFLTELL